MKVMVADKFPPSGIQALETAGCHVISDPELKDASLAAALSAEQPSVLVVRSTKVTAAHLDAAPSLALIVRAGAGGNTIDVAAASSRGGFYSLAWLGDDERGECAAAPDARDKASFPVQLEQGNNLLLAKTSFLSGPWDLNLEIEEGMPSEHRLVQALKRWVEQTLDGAWFVQFRAVRLCLRLGFRARVNFCLQLVS